MKNRTVEIFAELGRRLTAFGTDDATDSLVAQACRENPWFLPGEVRLAARNIGQGMLSADALRGWLSLYPALPVREPKNVLVIMAGNIPFVGFQDLLCVLAAGHNAMLRMSSKDSVLMSHIVSELLDIASGLPVAMNEDSRFPDAVIAMGGDNAVRLFRGRYAGVPALLRGSRSSAAVLDGRETPETLSGLARDIFLYSGLGCRNVSLVFVPRGYDPAVLQAALSRNNLENNPKYIGNYRQAKALLKMNGEPFIDCGRCLMCGGRHFPTAVSRVNYAFYDSPGEVAEWLSTHDPEIQCVAGCFPHPRAVPHGCTQTPSLTDYPDGLDTMDFLAGI